MKYVLVPADKATNNAVVVLAIDTYAYKLQASLNKSVIVVDGHGSHTALHYCVKAKQFQDNVITSYWLPKLYKNPKKHK